MAGERAGFEMANANPAMAVGIALVLPTCGGDGDMQQQQEPAVLVELPPPVVEGEAALESALRRRRSEREYSREPLTLAQLGQLLWAAQGVTADWGGRTAPSAGALYPLELCVAASRVEGLAAGVYRYEPAEHGLTQLGSGDRLIEIAIASLGQDCVEDAAAVLVFAAVYARTTERYGQRGQRYVHMEVGHAAQNVHLQAAALELGTVVVGAFDDGPVRRALGLPREQHVLALMPVAPLP
jgi:SagB-type dehydrogenase family enzyme